MKKILDKPKRLDYIISIKNKKKEKENERNKRNNKRTQKFRRKKFW